MQLEQWADDNFELLQANCTTPSGSSAEWREVIAALREHRSYSAKRVAVWWDKEAEWHRLYCPRNAYSNDDCTLIFPTDIDDFCRMVEQELAMHDESVCGGLGI